MARATSIAEFKPSKAMQEILSRPYELPGNPDEDIYILGVSGGVDSCALAVIMTLKFPSVNFQYFFTDTQADHSATYETLEKFQNFLGVRIDMIEPEKGLYELIDHYNGFLPSANARYCTKDLKIKPLEKKMASLRPFMSMAKIHSFVGLRADEPSRVGFDSGDPSQLVHFPYRDMNVVKADVFRVMDETIGIPDFYKTKSRSGCSGCFFQRKGELTMQITWFPKDHLKAKSIEKLGGADAQRFQAKPASPLETFKVARNWLSYPLPTSWDHDSIEQPAKKRGPKKVKDATRADLFVAVEFELGTPFFGEPFVGFAQIVATSRSAAGIKKQINGRWEHLLESLWMKYADEDELRRDVRYVVYHISGDAALLDTKKDYEKNSFTLHQFWSLEQAEHWVKWAESVLLHAEKGEQEASGALMEGLELYKPKDPIINDLIDTREMEIEEEGEVEGSRAICWACSI